MNAIMTARSIRKNIDALRRVLEEKEAAEIDLKLAEYDRATALEVHAENATKTITASVVASMPADADEAAIIDAAAKVPHPDMLKATAALIARNAERAAAGIINENRAKIIEQLNTEFEAIRTEATKILPKISSCESASEAIRAGVAKEWGRAEDLADAHRALRREVDALRRDGLLPSFNDRHATWRHPETTPHHSDLPNLRQFARDVERVAWVAATRAEVDAARAEDQEADDVR